MKNGRLDATPLRSRNPTDETPSQPVPKSKYLQEQVYAHPVFQSHFVNRFLIQDAMVSIRRNLSNARLLHICVYMTYNKSVSTIVSTSFKNT
jgi:hypothetical protein